MSSDELDQTEVKSILGTVINASSYSSAIDQCLAWGRRGESRYVCVANVHMVMEGYDDNEFQRIVNAADLAVPDGMPLVWMLRGLGVAGQGRVRGPTLTPLLCEAAAAQGIKVGFYGSTPEVLASLRERMQAFFPALEIVYVYSPPFAAISKQRDEEIVAEINASGVQILFVGLGCPKQERWMYSHRGKVNAVMLGVGAAFDFCAGLVAECPQWLRNLGLEWTFRLAQEPRRLWKRYAKHNPRFALLSIFQLCGLKRFRAA